MKEFTDKELIDIVKNCNIDHTYDLVVNTIGNRDDEFRVHCRKENRYCNVKDCIIFALRIINDGVIFSDPDTSPCRATYNYYGKQLGSLLPIIRLKKL